jgi:hypothetical protein
VHGIKENGMRDPCGRYPAGRPATGIRLAASFIVVPGVLVCLAGCVMPPPTGAGQTMRAVPPPQPPPPSTQIIFYPAAGQSAERQDRDRYECYRWAEQQTGFDPGSPQVAPHQRVVAVPAVPSGVNVANGALTGAVVGAAVSNPRNAGGGAIAGAIAGAVLGAAVDASQEQQRQQVQQVVAQRDSGQAANSGRQAANFRRAMSACLEGRGYTVK